MLYIYIYIFRGHFVKATRIAIVAGSRRRDKEVKEMRQGEGERSSRPNFLIDEKVIVDREP